MKPKINHRFTLARDWASGRIVRRCIYGVVCSTRGCKQMGNPCWYPDDTDRPSEYYCYSHMRNAGFCPGCGNFWAGIESFDFSRTGYCEDCADEWRDDDYDDWDDLGEPEPDPWEEAMSNCYSSDWGRTCGAAGSEDCEFDCLIRRDYRRRNREVA